MLVSLNKVNFGYGGNTILKDVSFIISEGERVGLVGANGEGKTTLINLIVNRLIPDSGEITLKRGLRIGYLEQNGGYSCGNTVFEEMRQVFSEELSAVSKLELLSARLTSEKEGGAEYNRLSAAIDSLQKFIAARDCYDVEVKIRTVLNGMGFSEMYGRVIDSLSGGEKTRLKLARLLLESPDLLILDEPTNHLDMPTLYWLEDYLQSFGGAILVVSHDRYFLDRVAGRVLDLENKCVVSYAGNYSKYKVLKKEYYARLEKEYEALKEEREKLSKYVEKNIVRATTAKSAQSRVKKLEKLPLPEKPYTPPAPPRFRFLFDVASAKEALEILGADIVRGGKVLVRNCNLKVMRGDKLAVIGENGAGKSSLLKDIVSGGEGIRTGRNVKIAYYDQEGLILNPEATVLDELWGRHTGLSQTEARAELARCGLYEEDICKKTRELSGGERAKLALCIAVAERGNLLILDEPTNHLDLPALESLESALKSYEGTLVFVSHDRYFLSAVADRTAEIADGQLTVFDGGYAEFNRQKALENRPEKGAPSRRAEKPSAESYRSPKQRAEEERHKAEIKNLEREISALESREQEINAMLCDPAVTADYRASGALAEELNGIKLQLDALYKMYGEVL